MKVRTKVVGVAHDRSQLFAEIARPKWADSLSFPDNLTELTAANISELHGKYTQLYAFVNQELTKLNVKVLEHQTRDNQRRNLMLVRQPSLNSQERWRRDAAMDTDPTLMEIAKTLSHLRIRQEYSKMYLANFDRYLIALSRELSRRAMDGNVARYSPG